MLTQIINGRIFTPQGWLNEGSVLMRDGKILEVTNCDLALIGARLIDAKGMYIVPGFVCMHAHGGGGHDFTECTEEAFRSIINDTSVMALRVSTLPFPRLRSKSCTRQPKCAKSLWQSPEAPYWDCTLKVPISTRKWQANSLPTR